MENAAYNSYPSYPFIKTKKENCKMARYQKAMQTPNPSETYAPAINQYMLNEGFTLVDYKGQKVWKKGFGVVTCPQYFSIQYQENVIYLEAFIRYAILPGVYVGEMGIDSFFAAVPKSLLKQRVNTVEGYIINLWQIAQQNQAAMQQQPSAQG